MYVDAKIFFLLVSVSVFINDKVDNHSFWTPPGVSSAYKWHKLRSESI